MDIRISFPGGKRVDAEVGAHVVRTDQPRTGGGDDSAPAPFDLFLASLGTCAGIYVLGFCQARGIPTTGIELLQRVTYDDSGHVVTAVELELHLPATFPAQYRAAVVRAAEGCKVKKLLANPPRVLVQAVVHQCGALELSA